MFPPVYTWHLRCFLTLIHLFQINRYRLTGSPSDHDDNRTPTLQSLPPCHGTRPIRPSGGWCPHVVRVHVGSQMSSLAATSSADSVSSASRHPVHGVARDQLRHPVARSLPERFTPRGTGSGRSNRVCNPCAGNCPSAGVDRANEPRFTMGAGRSRCKRDASMRQARGKMARSYLRDCMSTRKPIPVAPRVAPPVIRAEVV